MSYMYGTSLLYESFECHVLQSFLPEDLYDQQKSVFKRIMANVHKIPREKIGIKCFNRFLLVAHGRKPSKPHLHGPIRRRISEEDRNV